MVPPNCSSLRIRYLPERSCAGADFLQRKHITDGGLKSASNDEQASKLLHNAACTSGVEHSIMTADSS